MKTIIAGSRTITDQAYIESIIEKSYLDITEVVCGEAKGVDLAGRRWAEKK